MSQTWDPERKLLMLEQQEQNESLIYWILKAGRGGGVRSTLTSSLSAESIANSKSAGDTRANCHCQSEISIAMVKLTPKIRQECVFFISLHLLFSLLSCSLMADHSRKP